MDLNDLARRITRLEDLEAIKQLKARYCEICDDDHNPERITGVFTDDGIWEGRGIGRAEGHAAIRTLFARFRELMSFSQHMVMNPIIEIEGDRAHGTWYFFGPFTFRRDNQAKWQSTRYREEYVKLDGEWKIRRLTVAGPGMSADYETGWARTTAT